MFVRRGLLAAAAICLLALVAWFSGHTATAHAATSSRAALRTVVTTDMEQDDYDELIRYLLYTNEIDTQGIVYSASRFHWSGDGKGTLYFHSGREYTTPQTSWRWTGNTTIEDQVLPAYAASYPNLHAQDPAFPTPDYLKSITKLGNVDFEGEMDHDTPGSDLIKARLLDDDPRPLWLQVWGGMNTVGRALKSIEDQYKGTADWPALYNKISAKTIISANSTTQDDVYANYVKLDWPDVPVYNQGSGSWGYLRTAAQTSPQPADQDYFGSTWTKQNVLDVGPLGALYYTWGDGRQMAGDQLDVFGLVPYPSGYFIPPPGRPQYAFISEGDDPAYLNLFDNGLRGWQDPTWGGFGGRDTRSGATSLWNANTRESDESGAPSASQTLTTAATVGDSALKVPATTGFSAGDPIRIDTGTATEASTIASVAAGVLNLAAPLGKPHAAAAPVVGYGKAGFGSARYVSIAQRDFANRLRWTVTPSYANANHAPVVTVPALDRSAAAGDTVVLDGSATDPDGNALTYKWWEYKDVDTYPGAIAFASATTAKTSFVVPGDARPGQTIHAILEVTDNGSPSLTRYARVVVTVAASAPTTIGASVSATLSLTLGATPSFGAFTPGVTKDYDASMTATVISTAGDAALSVVDPSSTAPGHLVNAAFSLPQALRATASSPGGAAAPGGAVSGASLMLESWAAPISNDPVTVAFKQSIGANDALRTGSYSKTLTFTLSTTTP